MKRKAEEEAGVQKVALPGGMIGFAQAGIVMKRPATHYEIEDIKAGKIPTAEGEKKD